jgi:hypothetical protein
VAHIHFIQTFTVEEFHRDYLSRGRPCSFQIAPGNAGVKPRPLVGWPPRAASVESRARRQVAAGGARVASCPSVFGVMGSPAGLTTARCCPLPAPRTP